MFQSPKLKALPHIHHGFFGRQGGVSESLYASLNCGYGSGDDLDKVTENRRRVCEKLGQSAPLLTCFQIHSAKVVKVEKPWAWKDSPEADAMVTDKPNIPLGILTADCLPVLFSDTKKKIIGAAHAGWKGAISGVLEATLQAMHELGAQDISAAIGPAISQDSYEIGAEFYERFLQESAKNSKFFKTSVKAGHHMFDLAGYAESRLKRAGLAEIQRLPYDTCSLENEFFSYRRSTLRSESVYGRQVAAIVME